MTEEMTQPPTILVVDDEPDHAALVATVLRRDGIEVLTATSATQALEIASRKTLAAAILDVMMGHLSEGFDLARELRSRHETARTPILFLTGLGRVYDLDSQIGEDWVPGDRLLHKPVTPEELLRAVREVLAARPKPEVQRP